MSDHTAALAFVAGKAWAIDQATLAAQVQSLVGTTYSPPPTVAAGLQQHYRTQAGGGFGVLPIHGPITYRPSIWTHLFGGCAIVDLRVGLRALVESRDVEVIVVALDTPGGTVEGMPEFTDEIHQASARKPVIALVDTMACSAGYWIASQCSEILVTPSSLVGSCGVFWVHGDFSKMNERMGYSPTYIFAGRYKVEGHPDAPLGDEAHRHIQSTIDRMHAMFVDGIVRGRRRGLTDAVVRRSFGEGRTVSAEDAMAKRMVDRCCATPDEAFRYAVERGRTLQYDRDAIAVCNALSGISPHDILAAAEQQLADDAGAILEALASSDLEGLADQLAEDSITRYLESYSK